MKTSVILYSVSYVYSAGTHRQDPKDLQNYNFINTCTIIKCICIVLIFIQNFIRLFEDRRRLNLFDRFFASQKMHYVTIFTNINKC